MCNFMLNKLLSESESEASGQNFDILGADILQTW